MKIWINTSFKGFYPVGTAAAVAAKSAKQASWLLNNELETIGLTRSTRPEHMVEMRALEGNVQILNNGDY